MEKNFGKVAATSWRPAGEPQATCRPGAHNSRYSSTGVGFENPIAHLSSVYQHFTTFSVARAGAHAHTSMTELEQKIEKSIALIKKGEKTALRYQDYGYNVAFSGGKDSQVIAQLAKMAGVKYRMVHNMTTMDAPETMNFIKTNYPECIIRRPRRSFWQLCVDHKMLPTMLMRFCCKELKEKSDPGAVTITGVRHQESMRRANREEVVLMTRRRHPDFVGGSYDEFEQHQQIEVQCLRGLDKLVINPILEWSENDVWDFLHDNNIPTCSLYQRKRRIGCLFCPIQTTRGIWQDVREYPKHYYAFIKMIHRIRQARIQDKGYDHWGDLSDEEVFAWYASKKSFEEFYAERKMPSLFDNH